MGMFVLVLCLIGLIYYFMNKEAEKEKARAKRVSEENHIKHIEFLASVESRLNELIQQHIKTLDKKHSQSITQDDYGNYLVEKLDRELTYFIDTVLSKDELIATYLHVDLIRRLCVVGCEQHMVESANERILEIKHKIMDAILEYQNDNIHTFIDIDNLDPIEFEHYCADVLRGDGWDARVTQASGDQGIDVIATYGTVKAVFQCKKYAQPVGNGAVQEIIAGKQFEQADIAAVVSNATFTPSAKQLASTTGVHLLHYSELHGFAEKIARRL